MHPYQAPGGNVCAVAAQLRGNGLSTDSRSRLKSVHEGGGQRIGGWNDGGDPLEDGLLVDLADGQAVGFVVTSDSSAQPRDTIVRRPSSRAFLIIVSLASCPARMLPKPKEMGGSPFSRNASSLGTADVYPAGSRHLRMRSANTA